jgi:hypothetical protein
VKDLIEALNIFSKYTDTDTEWPTNCSHDWLGIMQVRRDQPSEAEVNRLDELGFLWSDEFDCWGSFRFGSA